MKNFLSAVRRRARIILSVLAILLLVGGFYFWQVTGNRVFIDDSLVNASLITVNAPASGTLTEMDAVEGKTIKKGDTIAVVGGQTVRSSVDGLVVMADDAVGGSVTSQTPIAQLVDLSQMRIAGTIDENKGLDNVHVGQVASFTVDAFPGQTFWGYVDEISSTAKQTQLAFSISSERPTQQFIVYVRFPAEKYPQLKNGMSAKLTIYTATH